MIPKTIWRIWLNDKEPCPEFKEVSEYDNKLVTLENYAEYINNPVPYLSEAIERKKWTHAADVLRLLLLVKNGGIYLDIDVEVIKKFDDLLEEDAFAGFESEGYVNTAVLGSVSAGGLMMKYLLRMADMGNDLFDRTPAQNGPQLLSEILVDIGLKCNGSTQRLRFGNENIAILNPKAFYPYHYTETFSLDCLTKDTYAIHRWNHLWKK